MKWWNIKENEYKAVLTEKQWLLLASFLNKDVREILYWGWARWWKTWWVSEIIIASCLQYPWIVWMVWRKQWTDLRETTLNTILKVMASHWWREWREYTINMQEKKIKMFNGSKILFMALRLEPSDMDYNRLGSYEITHAFVDEAQEVPRKAIDVLKTRMSEKVKEYWLSPKLLMWCNPWKWHLYNDFISPFMNWNLAKERVFISALYKDNPLVDSEKYEKQYESASKAVKERLLNWNWEYDDSPWRLYDYDDIIYMFSNQKWIRGDRYITCDVARHWRDNAVILVWAWWCIIDIKILWKCWIDELKLEIERLASVYNIEMDQVIADEDWVGWWLVDMLKCKGFINNSSPIHPFSAKIIDYKKQNYVNLKTQCYFELAKPIKARAISIDTENWDFMDKLSEELDCMVEVDIDKDWKKKIISKQELKDKLGRSPDFADAMMMRMYFELKNTKPSYAEEFSLSTAEYDTNPYINKIIEDAESSIEKELEEAFNERMQDITRVY